jgi:purine catabolism regulator
MDAMGTNVVAGHEGLDHRVLWAHSCELWPPEQWLGPDELLMTVGLCIPHDEAGQVDLIRRLDAAGLAGIAIGADEAAPPLSPGMLAQADALGFPVLQTTHSVPFATIGRIVAAANSESQTQQVLTLSRLYRSVLEGSERPGSFIPALEATFGVRLSAVDAETGVAVLPGQLRPDRADLLAFLSERATLTPGQMSRLGSMGREAITVWQVPASRPTVLLVDERRATMLDAFTIVHLVRAVSIEVNRRTAELMGRATRLSQLLAAVFQSEGGAARVEREAAELGLDVTRMVMVASRASHEGAPVVPTLTLSDVVHASIRQRGNTIVCVAAADAPEVRAALERLEVRAGVSQPFAGLAGVREATLGARWALESVGEADARVLDYADAEFSVVPRSPGQANEVVRRILGPLLEGGGPESPLLATLIAYLDEDKNWTATAERLSIHRQTLAYRLKQIERVTGRSFKRTGDLAELWIATSALKRFSDGDYAQ